MVRRKFAAHDLQDHVVIGVVVGMALADFVQGAAAAVADIEGLIGELRKQSLPCQAASGGGHDARNPPPDLERNRRIGQAVHQQAGHFGAILHQ